MAAPINSFEVVESIRFFASLAGTEGVSIEVREKANDYILRLLNSLDESVTRASATASGLTVLEKDSPFR